MTASDKEFEERLIALKKAHEDLLERPNQPVEERNGLYVRYRYPVVTADHVPYYWRYDLDRERNPRLIERMGINSVFNAGAIKWGDGYVLVGRVEGTDRKSFFAVVESPNGVDNFRFWDYPITMPETDDPDVNVYDIRLTRHEDGWIYGVFCTERKDPDAPPGDTTAAMAQAGIARTKDLIEWERLPDLITPSRQQRNAVLHPEFVNGKYAFYTRPQEGFIDTGSGGGIGWGVCENITHAIITDEQIIEPKVYHTTKEMKNGQGPPPLKTPEGWLHLAHGVYNTAAGLRYVLYLFVTDLDEPWRVTFAPGGYLLAPQGEERVGDVSNVLFCNGWIADPDGAVFIYYGSSDTRMHVARSSVGRLLEFAKHTPPDPHRSAGCVANRVEMIDRNLRILRGS